MRTLYVNREHNPTALIIVFLGWGVPMEMFSKLHKPGHDILLISDYAGVTYEAIEDCLRETAEAHMDIWYCYTEYIVIGWSFGIKAASMFLAKTRLNVTGRIAVNGSEYHIDDSRGIPADIFNGTLENLSEASLKKFRMRTAGSRDRFMRYFDGAEDLPGARGLESLRKELEWFASLPSQPASRHKSVWDKVVIGEDDRIFPLENQIRGWEGYDIYRVPGMGHLPDLQWIIDNFVINKIRVSDQFGKAAKTYSENSYVQKRVAEKLYERFRKVYDVSRLRQSGRVRTGELSILELGFGNGNLTYLYMPDFKDIGGKLCLCDLDAVGEVADVIFSEEGEELTGELMIGLASVDIESEFGVDQTLRGRTRDIIFSSSMLQWLNSPATLLRRCANALRHSGLIAFAFYGPGTLHEISDILGNGLKYPSLEWMKRIARDCRLRIELAEEDEEILEFDSPREALTHLKNTGVNGLPKSSDTADVRRLIREWPVNENGKASLTFRPVYLILSNK